MKVLMTTDTVGGVWTYALQLADALSEHDVQVALATMGRLPSDAQREEAARTPGLQLFESAFKLEWMEDPWDDVGMAGEWLLDIERSVRPDLIHLNGYAHGALPWRAPTLVVGHSCVLSWWEAVRGQLPPLTLRRYTEEVGRGLRAAKMVVAPTRAMLDALSRHYGPLPTSLMIHNGRDPMQFRPAPKESFVLSVGRIWDEAKNVASLERIAPRLPWPVYVAGEEQHPDGGAASLSGVQPLGCLPPEELAAWFARAPLYALPARYEPFGLSVLEAALSGCALVLGDIPTLRELWDEAAIFVAPGDDDGLASALRDLIADDARRLRMSERARKRALDLTAVRMAEGYLAAYGELLGESSQPCWDFAPQYAVESA